MQNKSAILITIGDELLIGQTIDTNSAWIAQQLNKIGIVVKSRIAVGDNYKAITDCLDEVWLKADLFIVTGGLGPTSDDITKPLLCQYFGGKLIVNEEVKAHLLEMFAKRNRPIIERNLKQAEVPDNCKVLFNTLGTAPGMLFEKNNKVLISLPGVPFEMKHIMANVALPIIADKFQSIPFIHKTVFTAGEGESFIADKLVDFESKLPSYISLAYLPDAGMVKLRLTGYHTDEQLLNNELSALQEDICNILGKIVVAREDIPLEKIVLNAIKGTNVKVGFAESCTGGLIGHLITQVPGASSHFIGSIVSYANEIKENVLGVDKSIIVEKGAVSEATVLAMANGAKRLLGVDYAVAVSGVLGPNGGTERVKVGTVWIAVASPDKTIAKEFNFFYDRERNKDMAAKNALLFLWKVIVGQA